MSVIKKMVLKVTSFLPTTTEKQHNSKAPDKPLTDEDDSTYWDEREFEINTQSLNDYVAKTRERLEKKLEKDDYAENHEISGMSNSDYRKTALWERIREWIKNRDGGACQTCGYMTNSITRPLDVHHRNYNDDTLKGINSEGLITLCRYCHDKVEFFNNAKRLRSGEQKERRTCEKQKEVELLAMLENYRASLQAKKEDEENRELAKIDLNKKIKEHRDDLSLVLEESKFRGAKHFSLIFEANTTLPFRISMASLAHDFLLFLCSNLGGSQHRLSGRKNSIRMSIQNNYELPLYSDTTKQLLLRLTLLEPFSIEVKLAKDVTFDFEELLRGFIKDINAINYIEEPETSH